MERKKELEKEERTIFIVLAIIIMIAIGVLVTWYFTKDKKVEDKENKDTKTEIVDKQKKKDTSDEEIVYEEPVVTVISSKVNDVQPVKVVNVSSPKEEPYNAVVTDFNYNNSLYAIGQTINFRIARAIDPSNGNEVDLSNAKIISVKFYDDTINDYVEDDSSYTIDRKQNVTFNKEGEYLVTLTDINGNTYDYLVYIMTNENFNAMCSSIIEVVEATLALEDVKYYDETIWNSVVAKIEELKNILDSATITEKNEKIEELYLLLDNLDASKDYELEIEDAKAELDEIVVKAGTISPDDYTTESYAELEALLSTVDEVKNNEDVYAIRQLIEDIKNTINCLVEKVVDPNLPVDPTNPAPVTPENPEGTPVNPDDNSDDEPTDEEVDGTTEEDMGA